MMDNKKRCLLLLVVLGASITSSTGLVAMETTSRVFLALGNYFHADCLTLIATGSLSNHVTTTQISKKTSRKGVATTLLDVTKLFEASARSRHCLRTLHLLLYDGDDVRALLTQISENTRLSDALWLMILEESGDYENVFSGVNIPFDCQFLVAHPSGTDIILHEVYRVASTWPLRRERFGSWSADKGLTAPQGGLYTRRVSLHGLTIRATNVHEPPLNILSVTDGVMSVAGFFGNTWKLLEKRMNFTTVHGIPKEGGNRWEEMMWQLVRGEADCTASFIVHLSDRGEHLDFTVPLAIVPLRIFIAEPSGREMEWSDFLSPFSQSLWLALLVSTLTVAALLALLYHVMRRTVYPSEDAYPLPDAVFLVFGSIFCQQGHAQTPKTLPCRIVHIITFLLGIIAINTYSGSMMANLMVFTHPLPFETLEGIYTHKDYAFGMNDKSLPYMQCKNATSGILKLLYKRHLEDNPANLPPNNLASFQHVCGHRYAYVGISVALSILRDQLNCTVIYIPQRFSVMVTSLACQKGSPYTGIFNHNLMRLHSGGILKLLHKKQMGDERPSSPDDDVTPINLEAVTPMLSIVAMGIGFALIVFIVEWLWYKLTPSNDTRFAHAYQHQRVRIKRKMVI